MTAYVIAQIEVSDARAYEAYGAAYAADATADVERYGGRFLVLGGAPEVLEGAAPLNRVVMVEFPDRASALAWYDSPGYAAARKLRQAASAGTFVLVDAAD